MARCCCDPELGVSPRCAVHGDPDPDEVRRALEWMRQSPNLDWQQHTPVLIAAAEAWLREHG